MESSVRWLATGLLVVFAGCSKDNVEVRASGTGDFGRADMIAAAEEVGKHPSSPAAYREFALAVERLRPQFSQEVANEAERNLVFLALRPLQSVADLTPQRQLETLALTVWPTVLDAQPRPGETPMAYIQRLCDAQLTKECHSVVPEYWGLVVGSLVWQRFRDRARRALADCFGCVEAEKYSEAVAAFEAGDNALSRRLSLLGNAVKWDAWPVAGPHGQPWKELVVVEQQRQLLDLTILARESGGVMLVDGVEVEPGHNVEALAARRGSDRVIGVHLGPKESVRVLRSVLADASAANYRQVVLQARGEKYPYPLMGYHLAIDPTVKAKAVPARDSDTIQVLVRMLDAECAARGTVLRL